MTPVSPRPVLILRLLMLAAVLAFLQSIVVLTNLLEPATRFLAVSLFVAPLAGPLYAISIAIAVTFSYWINRTYGNLRAYRTPPRPHLDAASDFVRRGGDAEVLSELWAVTMSHTDTPSATVVEHWSYAWRATQIFCLLSMIAAMALPQRLALVILAVFFALIGASAILARHFVKAVSAEQSKRLDALAARRR